MKGIRNTNQVVVNNNINGTELKILEKLNKLGMLKTNKKRKPRMEAQMAPQMLQPGLPLGMGRMPTPLIREQAPTEALTRASIDEINRQTATNLAAQRQQLVDEVRAMRTDRFQEPQRFRANVEVESPFTDTEGNGDAVEQDIEEDVDTKEDQGDFTQVGSSEASAKSNVDVTAEPTVTFMPEEDQTFLQPVQEVSFESQEDENIKKTQDRISQLRKAFEDKVLDKYGISRQEAYDAVDAYIEGYQGEPNEPITLLSRSKTFQSYIKQYLKLQKDLKEYREKQAERFKQPRLEVSQPEEKQKGIVSFSQIQSPSLSSSFR